jgi:pimeloyl-ACP methyl ester carboxylesterase
MTAAVVLVHGAWHGAWCFEPVLERLVDAGVEAVAVDLPGHGADRGPLGDLHADAARVREVLDGLDRDCVLLGHSFGGAVITEAGVHPAVRHLVYLAAFALDAGESCMAAAVAESQAIDLAWDGPNLSDAFVAHDDGTITVEPSGAVEFLFHDCDPATATWAVDRLGPQPSVTLGDVPTAVAWRARPSTYIVCTEDRGIHPDLQRALARRCDERVEWPTSHSPFLSAPDRVADLVAGIARSLPTRG